MLCISLAQDYQQTLSHKEPLIKKQIKDKLPNLCWGEDGEEGKSNIRGITSGYEFYYIFEGKRFQGLS